MLGCWENAPTRIVECSSSLVVDCVRVAVVVVDKQDAKGFSLIFGSRVVNRSLARVATNIRIDSQLKYELAHLSLPRLRRHVQRL